MSVTFNPSSYVTDTGACKSTKTTFERNSDAYGPVAATAIGIADAATNGASSTVTISEHAINKLADTAHDVGGVINHGVSEVESGLQSVGHAINDGFHEAGHAVEHAYDEVKDAATTVYNGVTHAASSVGDAVGSVGSKLAAYAAIGAQAVKDWV